METPRTNYTGKSRLIATDYCLLVLGKESSRLKMHEHADLINLIAKDVCMIVGAVLECCASFVSLEGTARLTVFLSSINRSANGICTTQ